MLLIDQILIYIGAISVCNIAPLQSYGKMTSITSVVDQHQPKTLGGKIMGKFPTKEAEIVALGSAMMTGLTDNPGVYPDPPLPQASLGPLMNAYATSKNAAIAAKADVEAAVAQKNEALEALMAGIRKDLRYAENTVDFNNEKLALLGWSGRKTPEPIPTPGAPTDFTPVMQGSGSVIFQWKASTDDLAGPAKTYVVERRDKLNGDFTEWKQVGISLRPEITLADQPQGIQLEYRVIAMNHNGSSGASNSAAVVL